MSRQDENDAWRSIVENYGERAEIEPAPPEAEPETAYDDHQGWDEPNDDHFVPPTPPPLPHPTPVRLAAWIGVFGAPAVLLVAMVLALPLPGWLGKGLVAYFVAGFLYLVFHMERGPRDPWDNGARV